MSLVQYTLVHILNQHAQADLLNKLILLSLRPHGLPLPALSPLMLLAILKLVALPFPLSLAIDVDANGEFGDADEGV